jgi:hypothetical protein
MPVPYSTHEMNLENAAVFLKQGFAENYDFTEDNTRISTDKRIINP